MDPPRAIRLRAVVIGTLLIPLNLVFILQVEVVEASMQATNLSLFFNVVVSLAALVGINALVARLRPAAALSAGELRVVGMMLAVGSALCGVDMLQIFCGLIPHPYQFATPANRWDQLILPHLPKWLVVTDPVALENLYEGYSTFFEPRHIQAWIRPIVVWGVFLAGLLSVCLGTASLVRRPWADFERLTFPIIALPLTMTDGAGLWRDRLTWAGFALAAALNLSRALNTWVPAVPALPQKWDTAGLFATPPLDAVGWTPISWYPFALGLGYLMPLELSFSCWFFFVLWKVQLIARRLLGWGPLEGAWIGAQGAGSWFGLGLMAVYITRRELRATLLGAWRGEPSDEGLSSRGAWLAIAGGLAVVIGIGVRAGYGLAAVTAFFGLYLLLVLCIARMRAELGPPSHDLPRGGPDRILTALFGPGAFGPANLTFFTLMDWLTYSYRQHPAAHFLESFQIGRRSGLSPRRLTPILIWSCLIAYVAWMALALDSLYVHGFSARIKSYLDDASQQAWSELAATLQGDLGPNHAYVRQFFGGLAVCVVLTLARQRWVFFPLHPVGYAVNGNWTLSHLWFSLFAAWALKATLVRLGGLRVYRRALPFFFGLMLGDCLVGGGVCLISTYTDTPVRGFFP